MTKRITDRHLRMKPYDRRPSRINVRSEAANAEAVRNAQREFEALFKPSASWTYVDAVLDDTDVIGSCAMRNRRLNVTVQHVGQRKPTVREIAVRVWLGSAREAVFA